MDARIVIPLQTVDLVLERLEDVARTALYQGGLLDLDSLNKVAAISLAISQKRIADAMESKRDRQ